jgi:hypothetical protein
MSSDYEVGYGKPPEHSRFAKGRSGNPKGRPRGTKNLKADLIEELQERIQIRENDRAFQISKQRAVVKTVLARTLKGDMRAASTLFNAMFRLLDLVGEVPEDDQPLSAEDEELIEVLEARHRRKTGAALTSMDKAAGQKNDP